MSTNQTWWYKIILKKVDKVCRSSHTLSFVENIAQLYTHKPLKKKVMLKIMLKAKIKINKINKSIKSLMDQFIKLRWNPLGKWVILIFSRQKPWTRIF